MKRRRGLLKKAMELSILCDCEVAVFIMAKEEVNVFTSNGLPIDTVERALAMNPVITHNGTYESMYMNGEFDGASGDEGGDDEVEPNLAGGSLTDKTPTRSKRKRDQRTPAPGEEETMEHISEAMRPPPPQVKISPFKTKTETSFPSNDIQMANNSATTPTNSTFTPNSLLLQQQSMPSAESTQSLLQHIRTLSQLLQKTHSDVLSRSGGATPDESAVLSSNDSLNLLNSLKSFEATQQQQHTNNPSLNTSSLANKHQPVSNSNLSSADKNVGHTGNTNTTNINHNSSNNINNNNNSTPSPLIPLGELSPNMSTLSPHFHFPTGLTPPSLTSSLTPPSIDSSQLDSHFDGSPNVSAASSFSNFISSTGDSTSSKLNMSSGSTKSLTGSNNQLGGPSSSRPSFGLRVAVPQTAVFDIPPHLMSATIPPTTGPISGHTTPSNVNTNNGAHHGLPSTAAAMVSSTDSLENPEKHHPSIPAPPLSSMAPPITPFAGVVGPTLPTDWASMQSPMGGAPPAVFPSLYSPFYSPRI